MKALLKKFAKDETGLETVEYAIIAGMIVVGVVALIGTIGDWVHDAFFKLDSDLAANPIE